MPYTIVLTPPTTQAFQYIEASRNLFCDCQPSYLLNKNGTSSPHITVIQFECDSLDLVYKVWEKVKEKISAENIVPLKPPFTGMAFVEGTGIYENTTWVELSVKRGDAQSPIMRIHEAALEALKECDLKPLNACGNDYRPHLTLARIVIPEQIRIWSKALIQNPEGFSLELGLSDEQWQYAKTLEIFP